MFSKGGSLKFSDLWTKPAEYFDRLDTNRYQVKPATTSQDHKLARELRQKGYHMYFRESQPIPPEIPLPNETTFLAIEIGKNVPVGTLRVLDRSKGKIELDHFLQIDKLLTPAEHPCAEATRFTIPFQHPESLTIKLLLWKAFFDYCVQHRIATMLISSRPFFARMYTYLFFEDIGSAGEYRHTHLKNKVHRTYKLHLHGLKERWHSHGHTLYGFMSKRSHNISIGQDLFTVDNSKAQI